MNSLKAASNRTSDTNEDIDLLGIIDTLLDSRWLIFTITSIVLLFAVSYAFLSQPIYQANSLIQVENNENSTSSALKEMSALFSVESPASAEIEILRSRLVVSQAVDELGLYISATPNYLPLIGSWLAKRATEYSTPGILGIGGYVYGSESIEISKLDVPKILEGSTLQLKITEDGYTLNDPDGELLANGKVGKNVIFDYDNDTGNIYVAKLNGKPGATFNLVRSSRLKTISSLQQALDISERGKQSGIISASLEGPNPLKTAAILNAVGNAYVRQNIERKAAEAEKTLNFLDKFLPQLRTQMQESEEKYTQFRDAHGTFNLGAEGQLSLENSVSLQTRLLELEQKRRELSPRFQPNHPTIRTINDQIKAIESELNKVEGSVKRLPDLEQQLLSLTRNVQVNSEMYVNLLNSAQQLRLIKEGKVGNVRIVDNAVTPEFPVKPKRLLIIILGGFIGVLLGVILAMIRKWLRAGITDPSEIESVLGMHVFATVPHSPTQTKLHAKAINKTPERLVLAEQFPQDPAIESLRSLRTSLQFAMMDAPNNVVILTGPTPSIGKSFTSVNFATVLGSADMRILLIDADLRKGYINQYFGLERKNGFSELITGTLELDAAINRNILPNVDLITTGVLPPNPAELFMSKSVVNMLKLLSSQYDLVLLDTPPVLAVADTMALAPNAGTVFLLARAGISTLGEIDESAKRLQSVGTKVKGVIFNDVIPNNRRYGSKYGYYKYTNYEYGSSS